MAKRHNESDDSLELSSIVNNDDSGHKLARYLMAKDSAPKIRNLFGDKQRRISVQVELVKHISKQKAREVENKDEKRNSEHNSCRTSQVPVVQNRGSSQPNNDSENTPLTPITKRSRRHEAVLRAVDTLPSSSNKTHKNTPNSLRRLSLMRASLKNAKFSMPSELNATENETRFSDFEPALQNLLGCTSTPADGAHCKEIPATTNTNAANKEKINLLEHIILAPTTSSDCSTNKNSKQHEAPPVPDDYIKNAMRPRALTDHNQISMMLTDEEAGSSGENLQQVGATFVRPRTPNYRQSRKTKSNAQCDNVSMMLCSNTYDAGGDGDDEDTSVIFPLILQKRVHTKVLNNAVNTAVNTVNRVVKQVELGAVAATANLTPTNEKSTTKTFTAPKFAQKSPRQLEHNLNINSSTNAASKNSELSLNIDSSIQISTSSNSNVLTSQEKLLETQPLQTSTNAQLPKRCSQSHSKSVSPPDSETAASSPENNSVREQVITTRSVSPSQALLYEKTTSKPTNGKETTDKTTENKLLKTKTTAQLAKRRGRSHFKRVHSHTEASSSSRENTPVREQVIGACNASHSQALLYEKASSKPTIVQESKEKKTGHQQPQTSKNVQLLKRHDKTPTKSKHQLRVTSSSLRENSPVREQLFASRNVLPSQDLLNEKATAKPTTEKDTTRKPTKHKPAQAKTTAQMPKRRGSLRSKRVHCHRETSSSSRENSQVQEQVNASRNASPSEDLLYEKATPKSNTEQETIEKQNQPPQSSNDAPLLQRRVRLRSKRVHSCTETSSSSRENTPVREQTISVNGKSSSQALQVNKASTNATTAQEIPEKSPGNQPPKTKAEVKLLKRRGRIRSKRKCVQVQSLLSPAQSHDAPQKLQRKSTKSAALLQEKTSTIPASVQKSPEFERLDNSKRRGRLRSGSRSDQTQSSSLSRDHSPLREQSLRSISRSSSLPIGRESSDTEVESIPKAVDLESENLCGQFQNTTSSRESTPVKKKTQTKTLSRGAQRSQIPLHEETIFGQESEEKQMENPTTATTRTCGLTKNVPSERQTKAVSTRSNSRTRKKSSKQKALKASFQDKQKTNSPEPALFQQQPTTSTQERASVKDYPLSQVFPPQKTPTRTAVSIRTAARKQSLAVRRRRKKRSLLLTKPNKPKSKCHASTPDELSPVGEETATLPSYLPRTSTPFVNSLPAGEEKSAVHEHSIIHEEPSAQISTHEKTLGNYLPQPLVSPSERIPRTIASSPTSPPPPSPWREDSPPPSVLPKAKKRAAPKGKKAKNTATNSAPKSMSPVAVLSPTSSRESSPIKQKRANTRTQAKHKETSAIEQNCELRRSQRERKPPKIEPYAIEIYTRCWLPDEYLKLYKHKRNANKPKVMENSNQNNNNAIQQQNLAPQIEEKSSSNQVNAAPAASDADPNPELASCSNANKTSTENPSNIITWLQSSTAVAGSGGGGGSSHHNSNVHGHNKNFLSREFLLCENHNDIELRFYDDQSEQHALGYMIFKPKANKKMAALRHTGMKFVCMSGIFLFKIKDRNSVEIREYSCTSGDAFQLDIGDKYGIESLSETEVGQFMIIKEDQQVEKS